MLQKKLQLIHVSSEKIFLYHLSQNIDGLLELNVPEGTIQEGTISRSLSY